MKKSPPPSRHEEKPRRQQNNDQMHRTPHNQQEYTSSNGYSNLYSGYNSSGNLRALTMLEKERQVREAKTAKETRVMNQLKKQTNKEGQMYSNQFQMNSPRQLEQRRPEFIKHISTIKNTNQYGIFGQESVLKNGQTNENSPSSEIIHRHKAKNRQLRETTSNDFSQYQKLNDKLNYLQNKIVDLTTTIDRKREQKLAFFQLQKMERIKRFEKIQKQRAKVQAHSHGKSTFTSIKSGQASTSTTIGNKSQTSKPANMQSLKKFVTQVPQQKEYTATDFNPYSPRHNIYYISQIIKFHKEEKSLARDHLISSAQFLRMFQAAKVPSKQEITSRCVKIEKRNTHIDKKTVVFDLDQTLIHCNQSTDLPHDIKIKIKFPTGETIEAGINIRPYAIELLKAVSRNFQVIVFTASHSCYANVVLDYLDPTGQFIHHRLYREHCIFTPEGVYVKDLRVLNRDPSQIVLVDNAAYSYAFQLENAIPILPYYKGKNDYELKALQSYLQSMVFAKDVRQINKKTFKLNRYGEFDDIQMLVKGLYNEWM